MVAHFFLPSDIRADVIPWPIDIHYQQPEYWQVQPPQEGDHIRVSRGLYNHHGIYINAHEVIHFSALDDDNILGTDNQVISTSLKQFLRAGRLEVKHYSDDELNDLYPVPDIVQWARLCLGDKGYHLLFNNCEHFANYCTLGRFHSQQINNVLGGQPKMSFLGKIGEWLFGSKSSGGSRRSSSTVYEPDKVKVAEIERDKALRLAHAENDRVVLMKEAQLELMEFNAKMEAAVIEARARGFHALTQSFLAMLKEVNTLGEERLVLLEHASLQEVRHAEALYAELEKDIANDDFMTRKVPELYALLANYPDGTTAHQGFARGIDLQIAARVNFQIDQLSQLKQRRQAVIDSVLASKQLVHQHLNEVVAQRVAHMEHLLLIQQPQAQPSALTQPPVPALNQDLEQQGRLIG